VQLPFNGRIPGESRVTVVRKTHHPRRPVPPCPNWPLSSIFRNDLLAHSKNEKKLPTGSRFPEKPVLPRREMRRKRWVPGIRFGVCRRRRCPGATMLAKLINHNSLEMPNERQISITVAGSAGNQENRRGTLGRVWTFFRVDDAGLRAWPWFYVVMHNDDSARNTGRVTGGPAGIPARTGIPLSLFRSRASGSPSDNVIAPRTEPRANGIMIMIM